MSCPVGWWAQDTALPLARGYRYGSRSRREREIMVPTEHRTKHMHLKGVTGSGKTTLLRGMLYADVDSNRSVTLCDPHGDLANDLLGYIAEIAIPGDPTPQKLANLGDKLCLIEPHVQRFGVPTIDLLTPAPGQQPFELIDSVLEVLAEHWRDSFGPRLADCARYSLMLLQELRLSLVEIVPLLSDPAVRDALAARSQNRDVRQFFGHLAGLHPSVAREWLESSRNKFSAWLASPYIRPLFGATFGTINFREIIDGKILIIRLSRDHMKKESRGLLGALLLNQLHAAMLSREDTPPERRWLHIGYFDEFQEVWSPVFSDWLVGARKYNCGLVLAHQHLTQDPFSERPSVIEGVISNCHTRVVFATSHQDGSVLAPELFHPTGKAVKRQHAFLGIPTGEPSFWSLAEEKEHAIAELMLQRPGEAYINFKGLAGEDTSYCARVPWLPETVGNPEKVDLLREHCGRRFGRPVAEIEREIEARWEQLRAEAAPPPRRRRDFFR